MKVIAIYGNHGEAGRQTTLIADSAIIRSGKPMFVPKWARKFVGTPAIAYHIGRLGKTISRRFAHRYIESIAPAILIHAIDMNTNQIDERFSALATSFDGALLLGDWKDVDYSAKENDAIISFAINGNEVATVSEQEFVVGIEQLIADMSHHFTLKMGDIIISDCNDSKLPIEIGTTITGQLNGDEKLNVRIK